MDLLGRVVGRGDLPDVVRVPCLAVRQRTEARGVAALRQVLIAHEIVQPSVRGEDLGLDHGAVGRLEALAVRGREVLRHVPDGTPERRVLRPRNDLRLELRQHALGQHAGQRVALRRAFAHVDDCLVRPRDEPVHALQERVVVLDRLEGLLPAARAKLHERVRDRVELVQRDQVAGKAQALDLHLARGPEYLVRDTVLRTEPVGLDGLDALEVAALQTLIARPPVRRNGNLEPVVVARIADRRGEQRVERQVLREIAVEKLLQLFRLGSCAGGGGQRWAGSRGSSRGRAGGDRGGQGAQQRGHRRHEQGSIGHQEFPKTGS